VVEKTPEKVEQAPVAPTFPDQAKAEKMLGDAETAYKAFKWDSARNLAEGVLRMQAKPETLARARDIASGAPEVKNLFDKLDDKDELTRNFDTSPGLVAIDQGRETPTYAVPYTGDAKEPIIVEQDAANYVKTAIAAGAVKAFIKGNRDFIAGELHDNVLGVQLVDQAKVRADKQDEFKRKLAALRNSDQARDALGWYEAAKFAYRNRLDDQVTEMLDQALELDPFLVKSVREDKAGRLYAALIFHLKNKNQKQADTFMSIIKRKYADTDQGKQAQLYYDGKTQALLAAAAQEEQNRKAAEEARRTARIEKAKQAGDETKAKAIEQEKPVEQPDDAPTDVGNADDSKAQKYVDDGVAAMKTAEGMGATPQRNDTYHKAYESLKTAAAMYQKLYEQTKDESYQLKMQEANRMKFWAHKFITAF
jgi:hypothetical protein